MYKLKYLIIVLIFEIVLGLTFFDGNAQTPLKLSGDLSTIRIDDYADSEILEFSKEMKKSGYSMTEVERIALVNNMPASEIEKLKQRMAEVDNSGLNLKDNTDQSLNVAVSGSTKRKTGFYRDETDLEIFGAYLFNSENLSFEPTINIPTPQNYQLGPGDELIIQIWGASKQSYQKSINRDGAIVIENIGPIYLNGYSIEQAKAKIISGLSNLYAGLRGPDRNIYADVTLGKLRSIKVNIIGEVKSPGTYTLSSVSTIFNALYLCGGPSKNGSLRNIELFRNNELYISLDIYDFLIEGIQKDNIVLKENDIIRINPYKKRITIKGEVKRPGKFELTNNEDFNSLLKFAAGFTDAAFKSRVKIVRITDIERKILTIDKTSFDTLFLKSGDVITVESILDRFENRVSIRGAVMREGHYELTENLTLNQLISNAEGLREDAYLYRAQLFRLRDDLTTEVIPVDLSKSQENFILKKDDVLYISSIFDLKEDYTVSISGGILKPGNYPYFENMSIKELISLAGGFTESASSNKIEVARRIKGTTDDLSKTAIIFHFSIENGLEIGEEEDSFMLQPFDHIYIRKLPNYKEQETVTIRGEVIYPGKYTLSEKGENISSIIQRAGGLSDYAYIEGASLIRKKGEGYQKIGIDLLSILDHKKKAEDIRLYEGDILYIPEKLQTVSISGQVYSETATTYYANSSFKDYISEAGGYTDKAMKRKSYVKYANGRTDRTKNFLGIKIYPKIEPGAEIIVPTKPEKREVTVQEIISISSGIITLGLVIDNLVGNN